MLSGHLEIDVETENIALNWYALRVRNRFENSVAAHLHGRGYESFLPMYKCQRRWSDRFKEIELPLFAGYVFCHLNALNRLPVLTIPGVVHLVGVGRTPVPIDETEIAALQVAVKSGLPRQPWPYLEIGDRVEITQGPLCGMEGILLSFRGHQRLVLSVRLLQRSVAVEVEEARVLPLPSSTRPATTTKPPTGSKRLTTPSAATQASRTETAPSTYEGRDVFPNWTS
jgi:transcription antitermination factor NusG